MINMTDPTCEGDCGTCPDCEAYKLKVNTPEEVWDAVVEMVLKDKNLYWAELMKDMRV